MKEKTGFNKIVEYPLWSEVANQKEIKANGVVFRKLKDSVGIFYKTGKEKHFVIVSSLRDYAAEILKIMEYKRREML